MEDIDIVGKEFTIFDFGRFKQVTWYQSENMYLGTKGVVEELHSTYPEYANVKMTAGPGKTMKKHFPTHLIKEQLEAVQREEESKSIDDLLIEMKQLISRI